jgi:hypothetical protein
MTRPRIDPADLAALRAKPGVAETLLTQDDAAEHLVLLSDGGIGLPERLRLGRLAVTLFGYRLALMGLLRPPFDPAEPPPGDPPRDEMPF